MTRVRVTQQELDRARERTRRLARTGAQMSPSQAAHVLGLDLAEAVCCGLIAAGDRHAPSQLLSRYWSSRGWWTSVLALAHHHTRTQGRWRPRPTPPGPRELVLNLHVDLDGQGWTTLVLGQEAEDRPRPVQAKTLRPHLLSTPLPGLTAYARERIQVPSDLGGVRELAHPGVAGAASDELLALHALATHPAAVRP